MAGVCFVFGGVGSVRGWKGSSLDGRCRNGVIVRRAERVQLCAETGGDKGEEGGDSDVQDALELALRESIAEMKAKKSYGDREMDIVRLIGEQEIRALADSIKEDLENVREAERLRAIDTEAARRMGELLKKFDKQAEEIEETMEREKNLVVEEAERIRVLSEELAAMKEKKKVSDMRGKDVILFFSSWAFTIGSVFYIWRGIDSGSLKGSIDNAILDAAVAAVCFYFYSKGKAA